MKARPATPTTEESPAARAVRMRQQEAELRMFVEKYKAHNDAFERSINERHERWIALELDRPIKEQRKRP